MRHYYGKLSAALAVATALLLTACLSGGGGGNSGTASSAAPGPVAGTCTSVTYAAPSGAANNIVFTFDKAYTCGQFANGDWWVSEDASGFVTITSMTPAASGGRNGFDVNPSDKTKQRFDSVAGLATPPAPYDPTPVPGFTGFPFKVSGISSVVKTVGGFPTGGAYQSYLQFAAVLTVVAAPISNSNAVFRPGYFGSAGKSFYAVPSAAAVAALPAAPYTPGVSVPSAATFSIASIATRYQHVWLDNITPSAPVRLIHPTDNMPEYGRDIATDNAVNLLRMLLSDFNYADVTHKQALINYLQMAIDLKSMAAGGVTWDADGGHGNGRKLPLLVAHKVFGGTDFSNAIAASSFAEDQQVWRSGVTGEVLWGVVSTEALYWRTTRGALGELPPGGSKALADPYGRIDGGGYQVGDVFEYQICCTSKPWKYTVLALYLLGLETPPVSLPLPATNNLVEYVERWVKYGVKASDTFANINLATGVITSPAHVSVAPFPAVCARPMVPSVATYGTDYGPDGAGGCIPGTNNWTTVGDGNDAVDGGPPNAFGDQLWAWYR